ncbi:MAG: hypothetical protein GXP13_05635 [Gammaproteobacteria bacterium]|nr:hypothetical protein [Gammaproteobacteria bacterium]
MINKQKLILWFYLLTPAFFILDLLFSWDVRVSFLDDYTGWKILYYIFCFSIGLLMYRLPSLEYITGIIEGGVNILLLTLSVMLQYFNTIDNIGSSDEISNPLSITSVLNYLISGTFLLMTMQLHKSNEH